MVEAIEVQATSFSFIRSTSNVGAAASFLSAMAHPKRFHMLALLTKEELNAGALAERVELDQSSASQHLAKLRAAALVETRRQAQQVFYRCGADKVERILEVLRSADS